MVSNAAIIHFGEYFDFSVDFMLLFNYSYNAHFVGRFSTDFGCLLG